MDTATSSGEMETAKTTTITTNMMSTGRRKQELSLFIPQALNIGQIRVRDNKKRKRTTAKMTTKRLMTTKSIVSMLVLTFMLQLFMQTSIGAQAIKLPSFLSWIQPASQSQAASKSQSQQQQSLNSLTIPTQQHSLIHKHHLFGTQNVASSAAANSAAVQQQQDNEPMLVSASNLPEAKTQQPASGLRRPFQSMLLLAPSKHNHLFSALPKTLFGRLLSSSSSSTNPSSSVPTLSSTTPPSQTGAIPSLAMPTIAWSGPQKSANQQPMAGPYPNPTIAKFAQEQQQQQQAIAFNLNQYRQQLQLQQQQQQYQMQHHQKQPQQPHLGQLSINLPKKHALGLGESDEFMIVDASGAQHLGLEQMSNQDQLVQKPTFEQQHNYNHRQQQQQQQQQPPRKDYQEMPAIVITDQELEQQPRPVSSTSASNTSQATESGAIPQAQDSSNSAQISLEASKSNNSSELQIDSSSLMNATQATVLNGSAESGTKENATKGDSESLAQAEIEVAPSQQSAVSSSLLNQTVADNDKLRLAGENSRNHSMSGTNVLTTLISDELSKLKQEPETLNKTLSSMSQPLVALFLQDAGSLAVMRSNSNENSSSRNIDIQKTSTGNNNLQLFTANRDQIQQTPSQPQAQAATLENSSDNGDLESSAAAIIVSSPADGDSGNSIENSRALGDQLSGLSDEQIESFIIGPYKGLTSDSLHSQAQQILPTEQHHQFRDLPSSGSNSPAQFLANFQAQQMRPQHNHQAHFSVRPPQQSHVGLGMSSMASNLIQQAKSLIHLPFAHLATSQMATNHIPAVFRGQQQQISMSTSPQLIGGERFLLNRPDMMIDQSSSPPSSFNMQQAIYNGSPLEQPLAGVQMMRQVQGNHRYRHQQQQQQHQHRRPFYRQQQSAARPPSFAKNAPTYPSLSNNNQQPMFGQNSATNLKPIHETQQFGIQHNNGPIQQSRYFIRPAGAKQQQQQPQTAELSNVQSVDEKQASSKLRVPYFGENPTQQMQQHSMNRESVQLGAPNKFDSFDNSSSNVVNNDDDNNLQPQQQQQHLTVEGRQKVGKSHPLNDLATSRQAVQQSDFHFVVNHGGQVGFQPTPSVLLEQQQPINDAKQQQVNVQTKFKSGLYQIDPPKLADGANAEEQQQQEHVAIPDGESDSPAEEDEQQRQYLSAEQQTDQQRHLLAGSEPQGSQDVEDEDSEAQQHTDTRENESSSGAQDFARQVGATIGVGANNKTKKGQVFNEPIVPAGEQQEAKRASGNQRSRGKNLTQMKKLKHTQDITLYDFEVPQRQQQQQASSNQLPKQIAQPVSYLDTQVYTIPYTINVPQPALAENNRQVYRNTPSVSASYQTTSFQHPAPRHHRPHQQQPAFNPYSQIGRFPLFYLPPPPPSQPHPQALHEMVAPLNQQQQQPQYQTSQYQHLVQHTVGNIAAQTAPRPLHSDFGGQLSNQWPTLQQSFNPVPALAVQSISSNQDQQQGIIGQNRSASDEQLVQLTNSFEPTGAQVSGINNKQHYFHYQPVASLNHANQEQQHVATSLQENGARQLTNTEQAPVYEFPVSATQGPIEQQQQQAQLSQATESSQLNDFTSPNANRDSSANNPATAIVTTNDESAAVRENGDVPSLTSQRQNDRQEQNIASDIEPEREQQQLQLVSQPSNQISSPSAFCADRAPGLYADVSQRCKSYYQCAPTGHQMFHCNNQTQFNQKTQNCDWWYNVNCGGRLGSQADFEQAPVSTTTTTTTQATNAEPNTAQSGELLSRQPDRDAVASSIVVNQDSSSADNGVGQQVAPLSVLILTDDQSVRESEEQQKQQQQLQLSDSQNRASDRYNLRWNQQQQQQQQQRQQQQRDETDMFHHSDSMANITVAPDANDNQQRQQQLAAPSSTPSYSELQASAIKEIEAFAQRSSTTQDPLLGAQEQQQFNSDASSQQRQQSVDSRPQVGAILTGSEGASASSGSTDISNSPTVKPTNQSEGSSSSLDSSPNQSSSSVTLDPTISADATTSIQTNSASSEPQATTTTSSSVTSIPAAVAAAPTTTTTTSQQQSDEQSETANQENNQPANNKGRRLVQSEFGLGAKQGITTKSARSTSRFQFTRNSAISNDNLFSGKVLSDSGDTRPDEQYQQHANHRYKSETNDRAAAQIYSTSANQGSVNYMPADEHNNYLAVAAAAAKVASQQQEPAEQQVEGVTGAEKRAEKRFGERLINVEKITLSNNEKQIGSANRTQKR